MLSCSLSTLAIPSTPLAPYTSSCLVNVKNKMKMLFLIAAHLVLRLLRVRALLPAGQVTDHLMPLWPGRILCQYQVSISKFWRDFKIIYFQDRYLPPLSIKSIFIFCQESLNIELTECTYLCIKIKYWQPWCNTFSGWIIVVNRDTKRN